MKERAQLTPLCLSQNKCDACNYVTANEPQTRVEVECLGECVFVSLHSCEPTPLTSRRLGSGKWIQWLCFKGRTADVWLDKTGCRRGQFANILIK